MNKAYTTDYIKRDFGEPRNKKINFKYARQYFDLLEEDEYTIDDQTWSDLNMDQAFVKLDHTYSSPGQSKLYAMLRNPLFSQQKLDERSSMIDFLTRSADTRSKMQYIFYTLGLNRKNTFLDMVTGDINKNKAKYWIYTILGKIVPLIIIILAFIQKKPEYMLVLMASIYINIFINTREKKNIKSNGMIYLRKLLTAGKKLSSFKNEELKGYTTRIKELNSSLRAMDISTKAMTLSTMAAGLFEIFSLVFLIDEAAYYKVGEELDKKFDDIMELYALIGELDALAGMASYKKHVETLCSKPTFTDKICFNIEEGVQPLLPNGVPNSIHMKKRGIVLTGTNMSGKSTFLRMLGSNILLAQTFNFVLAKKYEACFFNLVSSISPDDNLSTGKSYYMAEAEGILRIIKALDKEVPVFCAIDEIFRGTNPIERISASAEILSYINKKKCISIVATHDRELTEILKENYKFHYFSETVSSKKGLNFDYKLKDGISSTKNAIKLLDYIGYPKEITEKAYERADKIEGFI